MPSVSFNTRYTWIDDSTYILRDFFRQNIGSFFPGVDPNAIPQTTFQNSFYSSVDVNMTIFNGAVFNGISYAAAAEEMTKKQLSSAENMTVFQVISTYLNVLYAEDILTLQNGYLELTDLNLKKAERMQEAGRYSKLEALRWKVEYQQQKSTVSQSTSAKRSALVSLARVTSTDMNEEIQTESEIPQVLVKESERLQNLSDDQLLQMIDLSDDELVEANAALAAVKSSEEMSKRYFRGSYSTFLPNLSLNYSYAWQENNTLDLDSYSPQTLMVNFSWPLFSGFQDYTNLKSNYYDYKRSQEQFNDQLQNLNFTLTQTVNKLINLKTQIELSKTNVEYSESNYKIVASQKEKGLVSNIDFIDAKLNLQNARLSQLKNRYDFISGMVELYYLLGKLETLL